MANMRLLFPNMIYSSVLTGPGWSTGDLSLEALKDPVLGHPARSVNVDPANTVIQVDLAQTRPVGGAIIIDSNMSVNAEYRVRLASDSAFTDVRYDSTQPAFPRVYKTADLNFEDRNWFYGTALPDERKRTTPQAICLFPKNLNARYLEISINDPGNLDGYIQLGKLFIGSVFDPPKNYAPDAVITVVDESKSSKSIGGTLYFDKRSKRRVMSFNFAGMVEQEQFSRFFDLTADAGITEEIFIVPSPDQAINLQRKSFCAHLREPTNLEQVVHRLMNASFIAEELI